MCITKLTVSVKWSSGANQILWYTYQWGFHVCNRLSLLAHLNDLVPELDHLIVWDGVRLPCLHFTLNQCQFILLLVPGKWKTAQETGGAILRGGRGLSPTATQKAVYMLVKVTHHKLCTTMCLHKVVCLYKNPYFGLITEYFFFFLGMVSSVTHKSLMSDFSWISPSAQGSSKPNWWPSRLESSPDDSDDESNCGGTNSWERSRENIECVEQWGVQDLLFPSHPDTRRWCVALWQTSLQSAFPSEHPMEGEHTHCLEAMGSFPEGKSHTVW